jgi:hypothetical protein
MMNTNKNLSLALTHFYFINYEDIPVSISGVVIALNEIDMHKSSK